MSSEEFQPSKSRMWVSVLSLIGLFIALYMLAHSVGLMGPVLCGLGDCAAVEASAYSRMGGIPVSAFGVVGYVLLFTLSLAGLQPRWAEAPSIAGGITVLAFVGFGFSVYLTYLEAIVIHAWCQWCVSSAILMTIIFFLSFAEIGRLRRAK
jgi:uncharacterized membrane protein